MNAFMRTPQAAAENPVNLIQRLKPLVDRILEGKSLAPPTHGATIQLLNNFSGAHYFAATRVPGPHQDASFAASFAMKKKVLRAQALNHGRGTCQRDVNYFQSLHRMLMGRFPTDADRKECEQEMEDLCWLHFGQAAVPDGVVAAVCR